MSDPATTTPRAARPAAHASRRPLAAAALAELQARFGPQCSVARAVREHHGRDESPLDVPPPDAVVYAHSHEDVVDAVRIAARHGVPLIPFGAGSSLEGHVLAVDGGMSLDLTRLDRVLRIEPEDLTATVQAGVSRLALNDALRGSGLFFPIDPGADATLGGMCATGASGTNAVRYGTMRENVLALTAVTAAGETIHTGTRARKSSAGYDLTRLLVGSEGTLAVITEVTLRLHPLPEAMSAALCHFPDVAAAVRTASLVIQSGIPIARCELLDALAVRAVNRHSHLALRESPLLLMEFHGSAAAVREQAESVQAIATEEGGGGFEWAVHPEERTRLWQARHMAYFAMLQLRPGSRSVTTDVCVPISRLAECIERTREDLDASSLETAIIGHVGDGNFHVLILVDPDDAAERARAEAANDRLTERALALGGTCTGEHGIGLHKMRFLARERDPATLAVMRALKRALDPGNILNPGKILPPPAGDV
ncbi:MAG: FAD-binding protein [Steroidobacteraceae bacterium]|jgi:D-lactate dehydrogenase (cytochrome)|nr:FAD-binding protein [Steroidobacteraceae bacterium]